MRLKIAATTVVAALVIVTLFVIARQPGNGSVPSIDLVSNQALQALPTKAPGTIDTSHLAKGIVPPTNKWFTGLALEQTPQAVYPTPLSFLPTATSFQIGLPPIRVTNTDIFGEATNDVTVQVQGATRYLVTRYDQVSVDITYYNGSIPLGTVTIAAGSPYVFFKADSNTMLSMQANGVFTGHGSAVSAQTAAGVVHLSGFSGTTLQPMAQQLTATQPRGSLTTFYILPNGAADALGQYAGNRLTDTAVSYGLQGDTYRTAITYRTANGRPTVITTLPHQQSGAVRPTSLQYSSIYGNMHTITGNLLSFTTPAVPVQDSLNVSKLSGGQQALLTRTLTQDAASTQLNAPDTYFAGKQLYRAAQLIQLAHQLHQTAVADSLQQQLASAFSDWFSDDATAAHYFYYDTTVHGIVGVKASFGTDSFNDHHFHYGYFIYAASILAKYDPTFLDQYKSSVNLLVADIANYKSGEALPLRRNFDPYFGHSWASGNAPFADGNNQESSSEAINAWTAAALWAQQTHNSALKTEAGWMLSSEVAANKDYWTAFDQSAAPYNNGYGESVIGMNWGGKRDYATFFSASPAAMLGIQLVPMNPSMAALATLPSRLQQNAQEALPDGNYNVQFGDYILMYQALGGKTNTLPIAQSISDQNIDTANSRTYMYAWLMTHSK